MILKGSLCYLTDSDGPALAAGDVNGDGRNDFFVGGAKGQAAAIYINEGNGKFVKKGMPIFDAHANFEDVDAVFADFDHDNDLDLYVVSGGNENNFQDRIYWNDGQGNFSYKTDILPSTASSGGTVVAFDFDNDGDLDIFRGGQVTPVPTRWPRGVIYSKMITEYLKM